MILFLKAAIAGGAVRDLFAAPVTVAGHMRGPTYVAPYQATRHHAPAAPAAPPNLLHADQATYERAVYDAAMARLDAGGEVVVGTSLRVTRIAAKHRDALRYARWKPEAETVAGKTWNTPSRPRTDKAPTGAKVRWARRLAA